VHLTLEDVSRVASLARLRLTESESAAFLKDLTAILDYVAILGEVDTTSVEPLVHAVELQNVLRDDVVLPSLPRDAALQNAPRTDGVHFLVPSIIDDK